VVLGPDPEVKVGIQRPGDLAPKERADALPAHATHDLADEEAEGVDVVAVGPAGLPPGLLLRERGRHELPVVHGKAGKRAADLGDVGHGSNSSGSPNPWYYPARNAGRLSRLSLDKRASEGTAADTGLAVAPSLPRWRPLATLAAWTSAAGSWRRSR